MTKPVGKVMISIDTFCKLMRACVEEREDPEDRVICLWTVAELLLMSLRESYAEIKVAKTMKKLIEWAQGGNHERGME